MKRNELEVGYLVELRSGHKAMVMPVDSDENPIILVGEKGLWNNLYCYNDDLNHIFHGSDDIIKVWDFSKIYRDVFSFDTKYRELLWERKEKRKMTVAEIERILGYEVEIVSES